uniref:WASP like actin nucleation promoting factor b n=1 Tax=Petromyzon marinus TaxID=7757 RepID=S4RNZ0_PETMA
CLTLASAVVQVHVALGDGRRWTKRCVGVACLVKDNPQRSYFIRVYSLKEGKLVWEQELYSQFKYNVQRTHFHTFEADDCQAGLSFASDEEARLFQEAIMEKLQRRHQRKAYQERPTSGCFLRQRLVLLRNEEINIGEFSRYSINSIIYTQEKLKGCAKKKKFCKADIGMPSNFQHVGHVGWDPNAGFDPYKSFSDQLRSRSNILIVWNFHLRPRSASKTLSNLELKGGCALRANQSNRQTPPPAPMSPRAGPLPPTPPQIEAPQPSKGRSHSSRPLPSKPSPTLPPSLPPSQRPTHQPP